MGKRTVTTCDICSCMFDGQEWATIKIRTNDGAPRFVSFDVCGQCVVENLPTLTHKGKLFMDSFVEHNLK
jgi:hypothetical protein